MNNNYKNDENSSERFQLEFEAAHAQRETWLANHRAGHAFEEYEHAVNCDYDDGHGEEEVVYDEYSSFEYRDEYLNSKRLNRWSEAAEDRLRRAENNLRRFNCRHNSW